MTSTVLAPTEQPMLHPTTTTATAPPPRKRRRRTAGGGASDDCFTCRNRAVKCDRKRPYCTQCIDIGKECSGYKTTLTWGVGVASRGKLRGLSCPIANKNADGTDASPTEIEARRRKSSTSKTKKEKDSDTAIFSARKVQTSTESPSAQSFAHTPLTPHGIAQSQNGWQVPGFQEHVFPRQTDRNRQSTSNQRSLQHLQTALGPQYDAADVPNSGQSVASYAETEFHTPLEYPHTPGSLTFPEQLGQPTSVPFSDQTLSAASMDNFNINHSSHNETLHSIAEAMDPSHATMSPLSEILYDSNDPLLGPVTDGSIHYDPFNTETLHPQDEEADDDRRDMALVDNRFGSPFFHVSPRLQTLMEYYDRNICPYLVAFDGSDNPYRKHILQLAINNEGLQNAIAALSTNNLRMRKKEPRRVGFVHEMSDNFNGGEVRDCNEPTPEESCYKQMSIDQLNMQLADSRAAQDDSVLATLLILCLFHVCDSGFSKFKTQLAGVQKLLSLRNPSTQSDFTGWVEMFFTWFDVMTSTVNDREMQIKGESLSMLDYTTNLGALEQFSGCDGRLFKLIARLGRLNLLAQGRAVRSGSGDQQAPRPSAVPRPSVRPMRKKKPSAKLKANKSLVAADYDMLDGNGWGTPIISSDEDADGSADEDVVALDGRDEFWTEWHDIRNRLQALQMDLPNDAAAVSPNAPSDPTELSIGQRDLLHINESFRFSALLYTERLGSPVLPSSHNHFQALVSQALYHITALPVTSCVNKFLMWPLFITGTECVDEGHKNTIRIRCAELSKESGFFNNMSSLDVLEKVWSEGGSNVRGREGEEVRARRRWSTASRTGQYGQAFRWRKAMDRVDGEYIII